jgi:hypothetical protein
MRSARQVKLYRQNLQSAKRQRIQLSNSCISVLRELTRRFTLSVAAGELIFFDGSWYITHAGLLHIASRRRCSGIQVNVIPSLSDPSRNTWVAKAEVYLSPTCKGFVGYGDADPSNVSPRVRGAEMRVAETRAVNRALRKAFGIGICSVEELGSFSGPLPPAAQSKKPAANAESVNGNGHHPLRDRLCLLIRQHRLDAALVKAYAADYCDVAELRRASREQVAAFTKHLAEYAEHDREALICQLNSYAPKRVSSAEGVVAASGEEKGAGAA